MRYASRAARRYARALWAEAGGLEPATALLVELKAFATQLDEEPDLRAFLEHRRIPPARKLEVLGGLEVGEGQPLLPASPLGRSFIDLVLRHQRANRLGEMVVALEDLLDTERGLVRARVTTAVPILKAERDLITAKVKELSGAREVELDCQVSKRILGGVVLHYGEHVIDASVRTYLDTMRETLRRVRVTEFDSDGFLPLDYQGLRAAARGQGSAG